MPDDDGGRGGAVPVLRERPRRRRAGGAVVAAVREAVVVVVSALVLSLLVKTFLLQAFVIPSVSMEQTLLVGDRVLMNRLVPSPVGLQRGDVVVFEDSSGWLRGEPQPELGPVGRALTFVGVLPDPGQGHLIKRVIGLPGDHVVGTVGGPTTVNGVAVDEQSYLAAGATPTEVDFDVTVPEGRIWVEGDNRQDSRDSRGHQDVDGGSVPLDDVVGRAVVIAWPLDRIGWLSDHAEVFAGVPAPPG